MDLTINWSHIIAIATFLIAGWVAVRNSMQKQLNDIGLSIVRLETKMDDLTEDVRKHNGVVERTGIVERDMKAMWVRHDELKERVHDLEKYHQKEV
ncbi:MAG: hypothetical protein IKE22_07590 [Atopobiaceae bacterium]|nr:hypothetical protein [Atopobiaceae bacterium]